MIAAQTTVAQMAMAQTMDPDNPTCLPNPNWSNYREMRFAVATIEGHRVLLAEGAIDDNLLPRLQGALRDETIEEVRLRSPGGNARVGNQDGALIRQSGLPTRIPAGWACAGSCAFMFMGGISRAVDPGGLFIVQMFTFTGDRQAIRDEVARGDEAAADLMTEIARQSARLATEDVDYLARMGISRALLTEIVYRQHAVPGATDRSTRRCLTDAELRHYNVIPQVVTGRPPRN
jgi:hypothetical protein